MLREKKPVLRVSRWFLCFSANRGRQNSLHFTVVSIVLRIISDISGIGNIA